MLCLSFMTPMDDIPPDTTASQTERAITPKNNGRARRAVSPESEVRGGPEAADETLDDASKAGHRKRR